MIMNNKKMIKFSSILLTTFLFVFSFANFAYADPVFTVNTNTVGQIDFVGSDLDGISEVYVYLTKKSNGTTQGSGSIGVVSGAFSHSFYGVTQGEEYEYSINGDGAPMKTGSVIAGSAVVDTGGSSGAGSGGSSGSGTGGSAGSGTGGSTGSGTGGSSGTGSGGSSGSGTGGSAGSGTGGSTGSGTGGSSGGSSGNDSSAQQIFLENPLKNVKSIEDLIKVIFDLIWKIGVWILAGFIIYTGFLFVSARGNPAKIKEAGEALKYTLVGGAILLGAWVIAEAIIGTINALK